jgi:hypothetical protein
MTNNTAKPNVFDALIDVLEKVKSALQSGEITSLDQYAKLQDDLRLKMERQPDSMVLSEHQIRKLAMAANHNQRLLNAALAGIRSATQRKSEIRDVLKTSQTYNRTGHRIRLIPDTNSCEKRS